MAWFREWGRVFCAIKFNYSFKKFGNLKLHFWKWRVFWDSISKLIEILTWYSNSHCSANIISSCKINLLDTLKYNSASYQLATFKNYFVYCAANGGLMLIDCKMILLAVHLMALDSPWFYNHQYCRCLSLSYIRNNR